MREGELPVSALRPAADISARTLSRNLRVLRDAGLVRRRARGEE